MKRVYKRAIIFGAISGVVGYFFASITFYFSGIYLIEDKNPLAFLYLLLILVFSFIFYFKNFNDFVYAKKKKKKLKSDNINIDWYKK
jgi:hypothetical protein